jgi:hypothetical protein
MCEEVLGNQVLSYGLGRYPRFNNRLNGRQNLMATTVIEGERQDEFVIVASQVHCGPDRVLQFGFQGGEVADVAQLSPLAVEFFGFGFDRPGQNLHDALDLVLGPPPVLG